MGQATIHQQVRTMVLKVAADDSSLATMDEVVRVREYNEESDKVAVEKMDSAV